MIEIRKIGLTFFHTNGFALNKAALSPLRASVGNSYFRILQKSQKKAKNAFANKNLCEFLDKIPLNLVQ